MARSRWRSGLIKAASAENLIGESRVEQLPRCPVTIGNDKPEGGQVPRLRIPHSAGAAGASRSIVEATTRRRWEIAGACCEVRVVIVISPLRYQGVRIGLPCQREGEAGIGERLRSPRSRLPLRTARVTSLKRCGATRLLPPRPTEPLRGLTPRERLRSFVLKRGFGVARAPSPDVRSGHPWPPLSRCRLRSAIHGCACRQRRLSEHGRPLAGGVRRRAAG